VKPASDQRGKRSGRRQDLRAREEAGQAFDACRARRRDLCLGQRAATGIRSGAGVRYGPLRKGLREVSRTTASEGESQELDFKWRDF